jgi:Trehalose utilisation
MGAPRFIVRLALAGALSATVMAQSAAPRKRLLVIGEEKGYRHEAVTHAMVTIQRLGREAGLWAKMYGKGRVFYSTLGHVEANWDRPEMQAMVAGAIKWALGLVDADVTPRPAPPGVDR